MTTICEDAIIAADNVQTAEGEEPLTETQKEHIAKKAKFIQLTRSFWAPVLRATYEAEEEKKAAEAKAEEKEQKDAELRVASQLSSVKGSNNIKHEESEDDADKVPPYTPLVPEQWLKYARELGKLHIMKHNKIIQVLMYLIKYSTREEICERDTNKLEWKKAKGFLFKPKNPGQADLFAQMSEYWPFGPKEDEYLEYQKLQYIQNSLENLSEEEVDDYSCTLGKLLRWLKMALDLRIEDVTGRRKKIYVLREDRENKIEQENDRQDRRSNKLAEEKRAFEQSMKV